MRYKTAMMAVALFVMCGTLAAKKFTESDMQELAALAAKVYGCASGAPEGMRCAMVPAVDSMSGKSYVEVRPAGLRIRILAAPSAGKKTIWMDVYRVDRKTGEATLIEWYIDRGADAELDDGDFTRAGHLAATGRLQSLQPQYIERLYQADELLFPAGGKKPGRMP